MRLHFYKYIFSVSVLACAGSLSAAEYQLAENPPESADEGITETEFGILREFRRDPRVIFLPIDEWRKTKGPFLRDGQLKFDFRTYYFDAELVDGSEPRAWAGGGELAYNSGVWRDTLAIGASWFGSYDLSSNSDAADSRLFGRGGSDISVLGKAHVDLYWKGVTGRFFRQELNLPYINRFDNRMIPNTFEAYGIGKEVGQVQFIVGQVTKIKTRSSDEFIDMGEAAGVAGSGAGVTLTGAKWVSDSEEFDIGFVNQHTRNIFNTAYAEANWRKRFGESYSINVSGQYTDQKSVGDERLADFDTDSWGVRVASAYHEALVTLAYTQTDEGGGILSPYGGKPSYLSMMIRDFDRANEKAWRAGLTYHFDRLGLPDLSVVVNAMKGRKARVAMTGTKLPDQSEYDYTIDYKPSKGILNGFWFRVRYAQVRENGAGKVTDQLRLIVNYSLPIL